MNFSYRYLFFHLFLSLSRSISPPLYFSLSLFLSSVSFNPCSFLYLPFYLTPIISCSIYLLFSRSLSTSIFSNPYEHFFLFPTLSLSLKRSPPLSFYLLSLLLCFSLLLAYLTVSLILSISLSLYLFHCILLSPSPSSTFLSFFPAQTDMGNVCLVFHFFFFCVRFIFHLNNSKSTASLKIDCSSYHPTPT